MFQVVTSEIKFWLFNSQPYKVFLFPMTTSDKNVILWSANNRILIEKMNTVISDAYITAYLYIKFKFNQLFNTVKSNPFPNITLRFYCVKCQVESLFSACDFILEISFQPCDNNIYFIH